MFFSVLASSSKANCTFLELSGVRILIDCGLSARATVQRLGEIGIDPGSIDAILVTHEHSDHIRGVPLLSKKYQIPVWANGATASFLGQCFVREEFITGEDFEVKNVVIHPFSIVHDAVEPVGFVLEGAGIRFGQATDLGKVTPLVKHSLQGCHALVVEANHDEELLQVCSYPWTVKQRISSTHGHLSNRSCGELLKDVLHADLQALVLGHLSQESNTPSHATQEVEKALNQGTPDYFHCGRIESSTPLFKLG
jgi:phosphoribosyl 1,2-cyclic phosphodiesterase